MSKLIRPIAIILTYSEIHQMPIMQIFLDLITLWMNDKLQSEILQINLSHIKFSFLTSPKRLMLKKLFNMNKKSKIFNHFLTRQKEVERMLKTLYQMEWPTGHSKSKLSLNIKTREKEKETIKLKKLLTYWTDLKMPNKMKISSYKTNNQFYKRFKLMIDQMQFKKVFKLNLMELTSNLNGLQKRETHSRNNLMML